MTKMVSFAILKIFFLTWVVFATHPEVVQGKISSCRVTSQRCKFPSPTGDYECASLNGGETGRDDGSLHFCYNEPYANVTVDAIAQCDNGCFKNGEPIDFGGEMSVISMTCRTVDSECKFPFTHDGITYNQCSQALLPGSDENEGKTEEEFLWCATQVDANGEMVPKMWGVCDLDACKQDSDVTKDNIGGDGQAVRIAEATILASSNEAGIHGTIFFEQKPEDGAEIHVFGRLENLPSGKHGFHVHRIGDTSDQCRAAGAHFNPENASHGGPSSRQKHAGDLGNILAGEEKVADVDFNVGHATLFGENSLIGKTLVIHANEDDLGVNKSDELSVAVGNAGSRLACAVIREDLSQWDLTIILIIVLAVVIVGLIIVMTALVAYCLKKKRRVIDVKGEEVVPFQNGVAKRTPLYDELSIPFIDASPTTTPKYGRSSERLSFLNRDSSIGRSRGSLSDEVAPKADVEC